MGQSTKPRTRDDIEFDILLQQREVDAYDAPFQRAWFLSGLTGLGLFATVMLFAVKEAPVGVAQVVLLVMVALIGAMAVTVLVQAYQRDERLVNARHELRRLELELRRLERGDAPALVP